MAASDLLLRRLLVRDEAEKLLEDFGGLFAGGELALISADARHFAGTRSCLPADMAALLARAFELASGEGGGDILEDSGIFLAPILVGSQLAGALVGRCPAPEHALSGLRRSLMLLLTQALEAREMARETLDRYRELNLLYHAGETIGACLDPEEIPRLELEEIRRVVQADVSLVCLAGLDPQEQGSLVVKASIGDAAEIELLKTSARELVADVLGGGSADIRALHPAPGQPFGAVVCAPLRARDRVLGVTLLGRRAGEPVFTASDAKLVVALADQSGIAIERAWLHEQEVQRQRLLEELALGRRIQLSLLPQDTPAIPGWEFAAIYRSAKEVGGDYYDFVKVPGTPERLGLVIADVTDKGLPAALMMASARAVLRTEALSGRQPAAALRRANQWLVQDTVTGVFLTAFYAILNTHNGELTFASGGHDRPLWLRAATGECEELRTRGIVLGAFRDVELEESQIHLAPGDALVCYTDGVTDVRDGNGDSFGDERLRQVVKSQAGATATGLLETIVSAAQEFAGDAPQSDDFTMFVVKRAAASSRGSRGKAAGDSAT
jgi:sigma-B regulation protein RsbU (phosphoserine phosphatase)